VNHDVIAEIIRRSLEAGHAVEIDGLGTLRCTGGKYRFRPQTEAQVFIAYVEEDLRQALRLRDGLKLYGCLPWLDKDKLLPGQNWPRAIERAIEVADAFVPCFSLHSVRKRGQFQSELRHALDCARRRPLEEAFVIPVRLDACNIPRRITDHVQYVDLFPDWDKGIKRVVRAIRKTARRRPLVDLA
jgi:hypothetical protein